MQAVVVDQRTLRASEDSSVDQLLGPARASGVAMIIAKLARSYVDLNRSPTDLDPDMFEDALPGDAQSRSPRVTAGLGVIARLAAEGQPIYGRKLRFAEARERLALAHAPYHRCLNVMIETARAAAQVAVLIDWHSMPAAAATNALSAGGRGCDMVLGDRFGSACAPALTDFVDAQLQALGYRCARNMPYAGGYTTEHYGQPGRGVHALQIEINRALYWNEALGTPTRGFQALSSDLALLTDRLLAEDWATTLA